MVYESLILFELLEFLIQTKVVCCNLQFPLEGFIVVMNKFCGQGKKCQTASTCKGICLDCQLIMFFQRLTLNCIVIKSVVLLESIHKKRIMFSFLFCIFFLFDVTVYSCVALLICPTNKLLLFWYKRNILTLFLRFYFGQGKKTKLKD